MPEYLTPGVYIEELNTGNKPIEGVSTSTVGFLGLAERGRTKTALITSYSEYVRAFGRASQDQQFAIREALTVANGGKGYTNSDGPHTVKLVGGTKSAAAEVSVRLEGGVVKAATLLTRGDYTAPPPNPAEIEGLTGGAADDAAKIGFIWAPTEIFLPYAVEAFFQNGGKRCFIQNVTPKTSTLATLSVESSTAGVNSLSVSAVSAGSWGRRVAIKIENGTNGGQRLTVIYWSTTPPYDNNTGKVSVDPTSRDPDKLRSSQRLEPQFVEVYDNIDPTTPASYYSYENQINGVSNLISLTQNGSVAPAPKDLTLLHTAGADGVLALDDFKGDPSAKPGEKTGLDALTEIDEISLLACPDAYVLGDNDHINDLLINQCEVLQSRFAILNSTSKNQDLAQFNINFNSKYAAFYYPWVNIVSPATGLKFPVPPCGHLAGIYARSDNTRGVQKDPANEPIRGIDSLCLNLTDEQQAILNPRGINALRYFKGYGNLVWGGRTTSRDPDWKYINVRRIFIYIEQSIFRSMKWAVFEINDEPTWAQIRRSVGDFLTRLWMDGVLQGATKEEAFFVRCDRTTMTQADIDNGRLICVIGIAPVKPAEFVIFRIGQWAGGGSVTE